MEKFLCIKSRAGHYKYYLCRNGFTLLGRVPCSMEQNSGFQDRKSPNTVLPLVMKPMLFHGHWFCRAIFLLDIFTDFFFLTVAAVQTYIIELSHFINCVEYSNLFHLKRSSISCPTSFEVLPR